MNFSEKYIEKVKINYLKKLERRKISLIDEREFYNELKSSRLPQQIMWGDYFFFNIRPVIQELIKLQAMSPKTGVPLSNLLENEKTINAHTNTFIYIRIIDHNSKCNIFLNISRLFLIFIINFFAVLLIWIGTFFLDKFSPDPYVSYSKVVGIIGIIYLSLQSRTLVYLVYYKIKYRSRYRFNFFQQ